MTSRIMQSSIRRIVGMAAIVAVMFGASATSSMAEHKFEPLFNGENLDGWKGETDLWSVEDGVIHGSTKDRKVPHNTFLYTEEEFTDFVLKIKVKLGNHNSGIQYRSHVFGDHQLKGYQADVAEKTYYGMIYEEGQRGIMQYWKDLSKEEQEAINAAADTFEWNEYVITCKGDHVTMKLNGIKVADIEDPDGNDKGVIGLQLHAGPGMDVWFKDIEIKRLGKKKKKD